MPALYHHLNLVVLTPIGLLCCTGGRASDGRPLNSTPFFRLSKFFWAGHSKSWLHDLWLILAVEFLPDVALAVYVPGPEALCPPFLVRTVMM